MIPSVHADCVCNYREVAEASQQSVISEPWALERLSGLLGLIPTQSVKRWPLAKVASHYRCRKRRRYAQAYQNILMGRFDLDKASRVRGFIKRDKLPAGERKVARLIQHRSFEFMLVHASFIKPIEKHLYSIVGLPFMGTRPTRLIAKGLDSWKRGALLSAKWSQFVDPVALCIDCTTFDRHVSAGCLQAVGSFYRRFIDHPLFERLCKEQIVNRVSLPGVDSYTVVGTRMSGDMDTALGNCVIMLGMALAAMRGFCKFDFVCDGDDAVVFVERHQHLRARSRLLEWYTAFGHVLKVDIVEEFQKLEFCKSYPLRIGGEWRMVRRPDKIFAGLASSSTHHLNGPTLSVLRLAADCELILNAGTPVIYPLVRRFRDKLGDGRVAKARALVALTNRMSLERAHKTLEITEQARLDFSLATGIPPEQQRELESMEFDLCLAEKPIWITHLHEWFQGVPLARATKETWC